MAEATEQLRCPICDQPFQSQEELHDHNRKAHSRMAAIRRIPGGVTNTGTTEPVHERHSDMAEERLEPERE